MKTTVAQNKLLIGYSTDMSVDTRYKTQDPIIVTVNCVTNPYFNGFEKKIVAISLMLSLKNA